MGHKEPTIANKNAPRVVDAVYLQYNANRQGGHELLHLATGAPIICCNVTPIPVTLAVICRVHALAELEKMPSGLKIKSCTGRMLYNSAWITGVDYNADTFDDKDIDNDNYVKPNNEENSDDDLEEDIDPKNESIKSTQMIMKISIPTKKMIPLMIIILIMILPSKTQHPKTKKKKQQTLIIILQHQQTKKLQMMTAKLQERSLTKVKIIPIIMKSSLFQAQIK